MKLFKIFCCLSVLTWLSAGCSPSNNASNAVRNGGTMMLSLGSYEELGHVNIANSDLTAKVTDANSLEVWVKVREVVPLSSDKTSAISNFETADDAGGIRNGFSGFWLVVVDLVDSGSDLTTNFASGVATLEVFGLPTPVTRSVEILPGSGTISPVMGRASDTNKDAESFYRASEIEAIRFSLVYPSQVSPASFSSPGVATGYSIDGIAVDISALGILTPTI